MNVEDIRVGASYFLTNPQKRKGKTLKRPNTVIRLEVVEGYGWIRVWYLERRADGSIHDRTHAARTAPLTVFAQNIVGEVEMPPLAKSRAWWAPGTILAA